jgi:hypothetical protein
MRIDAMIAGLLALLATTAPAFELGGPAPPQGMADLDTEAGFLVLHSDPRIRYEPGAERFAREAQRQLPAAIARVEWAHGRAFRSPVRIYICATTRSFIRLSPAAWAVNVGNRVFLSPRLFQSPGRLSGILVHELSHQHFIQYLGASSALPAWFREGFAVTVSGGAGAERVSRTAAVHAILSGRAFVPGSARGERFPKPASHYGLAPHMFYRQAAMFTAYLQRRDPAMFRRFVDWLLEGVPFDAAFEQAFNDTPQRLWKGFVADLR